MSTLPQIRGTPSVRNLVDAVRADAISEQEVLRSLSFMVESGIITVDSAHATWREILQVGNEKSEKLPLSRNQ